MARQGNGQTATFGNLDLNKQTRVEVYKHKISCSSCRLCRGIKKHWRIKGHWKEFDQTRDEMIYIIRWLEDLDRKFMELLLMDFTRWNTEFFNTAGWLQTIHEWKNLATIGKMKPLKIKTLRVVLDLFLMTKKSIKNL